MTTSLALLGPLAALTAAFNVPLGRLRAGADRRSHRWFGLLAASALFVPALRHAFDLAWGETAWVFVAMLLGRIVGTRYWDERAEPSPLRWRFAAYVAISGGLLLLAGEPAHAQTNAWQRLDADEPAPAFTLTDQNGRRVALKDFRGKALVLTFIFTECKDICPVLPQIVGRADQWLADEEKRQVRFVGVSIDPRRDTPEKLRGFMRDQQLSPARWTLLTGSLGEVNKVADDYGIVAKPDLQGDIVHNAVFVLVDPRGRLRTEFHGLSTPTQEIVKALRDIVAGKRTTKRKG